MSGDRLDLLSRINELEKENKVLKERATPKKPKKLTKKDHGYTHVCPECNLLIGLEQMTYGKIFICIYQENYCPNCGQAIDWSEEE